MIPRSEVAAFAAAVSDVLCLPVPAPTAEDRAGYQAELALRAAHVRAWADAVVTAPQVPLLEITTGMAGLGVQRSLLPYLTGPDRAYLEAQLVEQRHQLLDPAVPVLPVAVPAAGGAR
ncbi:hypothetical protein [Actinacidiphila sp. ITFR-21]|uniref:hypothetical protein n=1 Tax=Actinacidiphila sp. ITFR-21 TaxID=3075199 RepID=UPI00288C0BD9|nr:hypothetical protein [Streptomyces sp. ITFR-21]WNI16649.1 hypothetical protein RLT57_14755 [Streptomyces sp. ITFR-21]